MLPEAVGTAAALCFPAGDQSGEDLAAVTGIPVAVSVHASTGRSFSSSSVMLVLCDVLQILFSLSLQQAVDFHVYSSIFCLLDILKKSFPTLEDGVR